MGKNRGSLLLGGILLGLICEFSLGDGLGYNILYGKNSYHRGSVAFLGGQQYDPNMQRQVNGLIVSASDGELVTGGGVDGKNVQVWCVLDGFLYGTEGNVGAGRLCKSSDGIHWIRTNATNSFSLLFRTPGGALLGWNVTTKKLYRSADGGGSFTEVTPQADNAFSPTAVLSARWSLASNPNGTMLLCEYGPSSLLGGRYIFRSTDDGVTWVRCFDGTAITSNSANQLYHWHTVCYHQKAGRWIAACGDTMNRRAIVYSDDDGLTWSILRAPTTLHDQPIALIDYGDSTKLLAGTDGVFSLATLDVVTGEIVHKFTGVQHTANSYYFFDLQKILGLYYAFHASTLSSVNTISIFVSPDMETWVPYHRFDVGETINAAYCAGYLNGKIHCRTISDATLINKHLRISPAKLMSAQGILHSPASTNLLSASDSSLETDMGGWSKPAAWQASRSNGSALHGSFSYQVNIPPGSSTNAIMMNTDLPLQEGKTYIGMAAVRGDECFVDFKFYKSTSPTGYKGGSRYYGIDSEWQMIYTAPYTIPTGEGDFYRLHITVTPGSLSRTVYVDCVGVFEVPFVPWQLGGTPQVADALSQTITIDNEFTDIFAVQTLWVSEYYRAPSPLVIKTWALDDDNKIDVLFDPSDSKFKLRRIVNGTAEITAESVPQYWHGNACLKFLLRVSASECNLTIQNGRTTEVLRNDGMPLLLNAEISSIYGSFPMVVWEGWKYQNLYSGWLSDSDVSDVMKLVIPDSITPSVDLDKDGDIDMDDFSIFSEYWLCHGDFRQDFNNDQNVDIQDFGMLASQWCRQ